MRTRASTANENHHQQVAGRTAGLTTLSRQDVEDDLSSIDGSALTDDDGDTVMGDDESMMGDDDERPQTPPRFGSYDPGSVLLTPNKNKPRGQSHAQPADDGLRHSNHGTRNINDRVAFLRDPSLAVISQPAAPNGEGEERPATDRKHNKNKRLVFKEEPSVHLIPARSSSDENSEPGPSEPQAGPSTSDGSRASQEDGGGFTSEWNGSVRWYHDDHGTFVRDGSLPPEYYSHWGFPRELQPPRADSLQRPPERSPPPRLQRTDTELVIDEPQPSRQAQRAQPARRAPGAQPIAREQSIILERAPTSRKKQKDAQQLPTPRRSERIRIRMLTARQ
ncbi:hypothetical protein DICSQDRAFT_172461 [Dichomitus squalens LYAD-421 SS1]|uniref:Uncharacterized protein n=1 Tax=Dichomitus squalens (strain LYAD-421) TaxID=732165 RepID=R7SSM5_DICSQ|nr:uncharacterized protein DICSQDRAFT_172461 [Dichomitus squalens LYAD-421 SS1]EJF58963.1 hypothetical protein DICSQDRAFT_172461 [Dichomitus squalens LYAD-421 SS1]